MLPLRPLGTTSTKQLAQSLETPPLHEYQLALLNWERQQLVAKMKRARKSIQAEVRSYISFRTKDDPIRALIKKQQQKIMKKRQQRDLKHPEFVVDTRKESDMGRYDAYNDPYMIRFLSKGATIKQLAKTGMIDDVTSELRDSPGEGSKVLKSKMLQSKYRFCLFNKDPAVQMKL